MRKVHDDRAPQCAVLRDHAIQLSVKHWNEAWHVANTIPLPWYRVQALAAVAQHAPDTEVATLLRTAADLAASCGDEYKQTAVMTWVVRAATSRGYVEIAQQEVMRAVARAPQITPDCSRAAAMELMLVEATRLGPRETRAVATALLQAAIALRQTPHKRWRKWGKTYERQLHLWLLPAYAELSQELAKVWAQATAQRPAIPGASTRRVLITPPPSSADPPA